MVSNSILLPLFTVFLTTTLLVQHPPLASASTDFLAPLLAPILGNICKEVGCGRGKCKMSEDNGLQYECECDPGWRQTLSSNSSSFSFLPCVIPNCTLINSCSEADPPAPSHEIPMNASIFEPCNWAHCGGGVCNKTSSLKYSCECNEGYYNLFSNTGFPCYKNCSIGGDCPNMGLPISNTPTSTTSPPNLPDTSSSKGRPLQHEVFPWMKIVLLISIALAL